MITEDRENDLDFLEDQRGPRIGWMIGKDEVYEKRVGDKIARDQKESDGEMDRQLCAEEASIEPRMTAGDIVDEGDDDGDYVVKPPKKT